MKKKSRKDLVHIKNTASIIAYIIISIITAIIGVITYLFIASKTDEYYPGVLAFLNQISYANTREACYALIGRLIFVILVLAITFGGFALLILVANHVLKRPILSNMDLFPKEYYISDYPFTDDDRRNSVRHSYPYRQAYTVQIELTFDEIGEILHRMHVDADVYYDFPKSFLMPDNISWFRPRISLHTARRIAQDMQKCSIVLLTYKCTYPKRSRVERHEVIVRIRANLSGPTYISSDVIVGPDRR